MIKLSERKINPIVTMLLVAVFFVNFPIQIFADTLSVSISANNQHPSLTLATSTDSFTLSINSTGATACEMTAPGTGGVATTSTMTIDPSHPWYPAVGGSTTFTVSCTDGTTSVTDSVTVSLNAAPAPVGNPTIDVKAKGSRDSSYSDGPVTIQNGDTFTYEWSSTNATACLQTSPGTGGVSLSGTSSTIDPSHAWYPTTASSTTITISCTNGTTSATDSVVIRLAASGGGGGSSSPTIDVKAKGSRDSAYSDGPVTIQSGDTYTYQWTSANATACLQTSPGTGGVSLSGTSSTIDPSHAWYPTTASSTTITISCTNGTTSATDSVVIQLAAPTPGSGGGGGGGGGGGSPMPGGHRASVTPGQVLGAETVNYCPFLTSYMRMGQYNDPLQVTKLQAFLHAYGYTYVSLTGVFDQATDQAVRAFQMQYKSEILTPWGISDSTGYVYIRTLGKINQILCNTAIPPVHPTYTYKAYKPAPTVSKEGAPKEGCTCASSTPAVPTVGNYQSNAGGGTISGVQDSKGQSTGGRLAASIFSAPSSTADLMQHIYEFLLILIVLYILGSILENVLYKDVPENVRKRFYAKWITISAGLVLAILAVILLNDKFLIIPLLVALIASLLYMFMAKKDYTKTTVVESTVTEKKA